LASSALFDAARMTGVPVKDLVRPFLAGQLDLFSVDDNHVVAHIHGWGESWLVLATQTHGDN